jgi:S-adenosylmethionine decarboxylase
MTNLDELKIAMKQAVEASGATILGQIDHIFSNDNDPTSHGYTSAFILSESHATIHTYPEHGACFVDLFTCGDHCSYEHFDKVLREYLHPAAVSYQVLRRDSGVKILECKSLE